MKLRMKNHKLIYSVLIFFTLLLSLWLFNYQFMINIDRDKHIIFNELPILSDSEPVKYNWNATWGLEGNDECHGISVDSLGNIYCVGYSKNDGVDWDLKLVKFDSSGYQLWNRTYAGPYGTGQFAYDLAIDSSDNVYVVGCVHPVSALNSYIALFKYNSSGDLQWSNINFGAGGNTFNSGYAIALDSFGDIYVTGYTTSYGAGNRDICLIKYSSSGLIEWYRTWGGIENDVGNGIVLDLAGNIYITGSTYSYGAGNYDICLLKYDSSGTLQWNRTWGGSGSDGSSSLALDTSNNIYIVGTSSSDLCLLKYNNTGTLQWSRTSGISITDYGEDIFIDSSDYIYLGGVVSSNGFDMYLAKYDKNGNRLWDYRWGGSGFEMCVSLTLESQSKIYLGGITTSYGAGDEDFSIVSLDILPQVIVNSPIQNTFFRNSAPDFNLTIIEPNLNASWYTLDDGITNIFFNGNIGVINQTEWNKKGDEAVTIKFYVNNTFGYKGFAEITIFKDINAPQVKINTPNPNQLFGINAPSFNVNISDLNLENMWYTLDNGVNNFTFVQNGTIDQNAWNLVPNGTVTIQFYANDSAGYIGFDDVIILKDSYIPQIAINSPLTGELFKEVAPLFNVTIIDANLDKMWYTINGGITKVIFTVNGSINQSLWDTIGDGIVILTFFANDTAGNLFSDSVNIIKDIAAPSIAIILPTLNDVFVIDAPNFEISIDEPNLESTWYTIDDGLTNITFSGLTGSIDQDVWDLAPYGSITIRFYARDITNKIGYEEVVVIKRKPEQPGPTIHGFNLLLIIGIIVVLPVISFKKFKKKN